MGSGEEQESRLRDETAERQAMHKNARRKQRCRFFNLTSHRIVHFVLKRAASFAPNDIQPEQYVYALVPYQSSATGT
jgi:hypothetical protein